MMCKGNPFTARVGEHFSSEDLGKIRKVRMGGERPDKKNK